MEDNQSYALNGKIMLCSVVTVFLVLLIMVGFRIFSRCFFDNHRRRRRRARHSSYYSVTPNTTTSTQGLDPSILHALPTFTYSFKTHDSPLECAVCLSEFEDDDKGRVLPKCEHFFHVECIDTWFQSVSNCPLCRAPIVADISVLKPEISSETENEPVGALTEPAHTEAAERGVSEFSQPVNLGPNGCRRKPSELMGVVVEVPRLGGLDEMDSGSPGEYRALSLKRICSI
ncbi:RING-H2 finger protein ATL5-like [Carya illinoinensis]|uniref:RING-type E3 ubiquitin transferase n=1 Tax=Carya illinoinensis TaxID=32201 RepID=A0A8T1Q207_CARIL|nr:RING-H2 finger protein ATL5-like [Carya illinoinensis]KAG6647907.1 hypothetical protein CIPAW_07G110800 [Carya illinoinensis]